MQQIDDFLIDKVFQPLCDHLHVRHGISAPWAAVAAMETASFAFVASFARQLATQAPGEAGLTLNLGVATAFLVIWLQMSVRATRRRAEAAERQIGAATAPPARPKMMLARILWLTFTLALHIIPAALAVLTGRLGMLSADASFFILCEASLVVALYLDACTARPPSTLGEKRPAERGRVAHARDVA